LPLLPLFEDDDSESAAAIPIARPLLLLKKMMTARYFLTVVIRVSLSTFNAEAWSMPQDRDGCDC
jgi:hypothetical protein